MNLYRHKWHIALSRTTHEYLECEKCGKRKIKYLVRGGYFPVDSAWLATGQFTEMTPPTGGSAVVAPEAS